MRKFWTLVLMGAVFVGIGLTANAKQRFEFGPFEYDDYYDVNDAYQADGKAGWWRKYSAEPRVRYYAPGFADQSEEYGWHNFWRLLYDPTDTNPGSRPCPKYNSGFGVAVTWETGARAEMTFHGTGVDLVYQEHHYGPYIDCYIDDEYANGDAPRVTINSYWNPPCPQTIVPVARDLTNGPHKLVVVHREHDPADGQPGGYNHTSIWNKQLMRIDAADVYSIEDDSIAGLQSQVDSLELAAGPQGAQGKVGADGAAGATGAAGAAGAAGAQGDQGKQGPAGDPAPCVQCQDVIDASFDLACQLFALVPPKTVDQFQDVADAAVAIAIVNANVCPDSHSGFAGCAEMVADQVQAVYDDKF